MPGFEVLREGDDGYESARRVWNAMVDRRPALVVRCRSASDVAAAIRRGTADGLEIGVRCGGHSITGHAVPDGGLMIDLRPMGGVRVDPGRQRAWVQGGALLGALDAATVPHGLATTAGNVSHTGVGGLTLGGGMGWLAREHGLACDNLLACEVVTASGDVVRASAEENVELFWGLRGGGGNFGVVTGFGFRLHRTSTRALSVDLDFPVARAHRAVACWRDLARDAPRQATYTAAVGSGIATLGLVWTGEPDEGREHAERLTSLGEPVARRVAELGYLDLQRREDDEQGHTRRRYWKGHYLRDLDDGAVAALLAHDPAVTAGLQAYGGAIADVPDGATAFGHRSTAFEYVGATRWTDPAEDDARITAARRSAAGLEPYADGVYVNALSDDGADGVRRAYPPGLLDRLTALKDAVDPGNVFHLNHNIAPSRSPAVG
jgi:FAD/FMN-containing dehydrogenase